MQCVQANFSFIGSIGGRVRKPIGRIQKPMPIGFKLIGSFSSIQGLEEDEDQTDFDGDCSLWLPVAPPGCLALGCVALQHIKGANSHQITLFIVPDHVTPHHIQNVLSTSSINFLYIWLTHTTLGQCSGVNLCLSHG